MTPDELNEYALGFAGVIEEPTFGPGTCVYKVAGKVFAVMRPDVPEVTLKCDPALALELRAQYAGVSEGYHMNKKHWNTVVLDGSVPGDEVREMVEHAYSVVVAGLPRAVRAELAG
jgi:predicted DNA-binding protein (MmcQ/YjbR family)